MKKILIFSDIQYRKYLRVESSQIDWLNIQLMATDEVFNIANTHNISDIVFNGDLFEQKNKIDVALYNKVWSYYKERAKSGFNLIFNVGNHDRSSVSGETSLIPFTEFSTVITKPTQLNICGLPISIIPFGSEISLKPEFPNSILFLHEEIEGLKIGTGNFYKKTDLELNDLKEWKYVFNGHIHKPQEMGNIINIGSLIQQDFGEAGEDKRVLLLGDDYSVMSIQVQGPRFFKGLKLNKKNILKQSSKYYFFRFDISEEEANDPIFERQEVFYKIVERKEREFRLKEGLSVNDEIEQYAEKFNENLNLKKLIKIGKRIIKDVGN